MNLIAIDVRYVCEKLENDKILHSISLGVPRACWMNIVGPNGAGKSTLLKVLAALLAHSGQVFLLGQPMAGMRGCERARQLAWLGQNESSADDLTVYDVAMLGRLPH